MKIALLSLILTLSTAAALLAQDPPELATITAAHARNTATSRAQHADRVFGLRKSYLADLDRLEKLAQAKGDLDTVLAIRAERDRTDRPLAPEEKKSLPATVSASRAKYDQAVARSAAQESAELAAQDRNFKAAMEALQARLTRAGNIEAAVKVKDLLQRTLGDAKAPPVAVAPAPAPAPAAPPRPLLPTLPAPAASVSAEPIAVATLVAAKKYVENPAPGAIPFECPSGNGRRGAKGVLLKNDPTTGRNGSTWAFQYTRARSDYGVQIIHPYQRGQFIVHLKKSEIGTSTPDKWVEVGWGTGDMKKVRLTKAAESVLPLEENTAYAVVSRVSPNGSFELSINGQVVATGRATGASPLSIEVSEDASFSGKGRSVEPFKGDGLPMKWEAGYAALIAAPMDQGANACRDVVFTPSAAAN